MRGQPPRSDAFRKPRAVLDRLADSFALDRSESEWLVTLLSADDLRFIFEGVRDGEDPD